MRIASRIIRRAEADDAHILNLPTITLSFAERRRTRQRLHLDNGEGEIGLSIDKGPPLRDGDILETEDALHILIKAASEEVARVTAPVPWQLTRAAYHLGNRHVLLEVAADFLQFEYDAVLVNMLNQLGGVIVERFQAAFEPEIGAYGGGHRHGHDESFEEDYALAQQAYLAHEAGPDDFAAGSHKDEADHDDAASGSQERHHDAHDAKLKSSRDDGQS